MARASGTCGRNGLGRVWLGRRERLGGADDEPVRLVRKRFPADVCGAARSGAKTLRTALERWVTQILQEQYTEALASAKSLREAWAKPGVKLPPQGKVEVAEVSAKGDEVTVPDTAVKLDGRTLRSLELIGATGDTGSFELSFKMQKHKGAWYVESFDLDL
jgi:hypothetical protein